MPFTRTVQHTPPRVADALAAWSSQLQRTLASQGVAQHYAMVDGDFLLDKRMVGAVDQSIGILIVNDSATSIAAANALKAKLTSHLADGTYAHGVADTTSAAITAPDATDDASCTTLMLEVKTTINAHLQRAASHAGLPPVVVLMQTTPNDLASNIVAVNEALTLYRRHIYSACEQLVLGTSG